MDIVCRSRKLLAVCDEQAECSENSCDLDFHIGRTHIVNSTTEITGVTEREKRISSARDVNVSDLWMIECHRYFQSRIVEWHREDSQGCCIIMKAVNSTSSRVDVSTHGN